MFLQPNPFTILINPSLLIWGVFPSKHDDSPLNQGMDEIHFEPRFESMIAAIVCWYLGNDHTRGSSVVQEFIPPQYPPQTNSQLIIFLALAKTCVQLDADLCVSV